MVQAYKALSIQSSLKTSHLDHKYASSAFKTSLWPNSKTKDHVIVPCESMLQQILVRIPEYVTRHINNTTWEVLNKRHIKFLKKDHDFLQTANFDNVFADDESLYLKPSSSPIPKFWRIQTVVLDESLYLKCSCCQFESIGVPCVHQAAVINKCFPIWNSFTHHDVALEWWTLYTSHAYTHSIFGKELMALIKNPFSGPSFPSSDNFSPLYSGSLLPASQKTHPVERCHNYNTDAKKHILQELNTGNITNLQQQRTIYEGTYTKDTYDCNNEEDEMTSSFFPEITQETVRGLKDRRDTFQKEINQVYAITNSLDDNFDKKFVTTLQEYINRGRQVLPIKMVIL